MCFPYHVLVNVLVNSDPGGGRWVWRSPGAGQAISLAPNDRCGAGARERERERDGVME